MNIHHQHGIKIHYFAAKYAKIFNPFLIRSFEKFIRNKSLTFTKSNYHNSNCYMANLIPSSRDFMISWGKLNASS